jgi:hypothetical protein
MLLKSRDEILNACESEGQVERLDEVVRASHIYTRSAPS